MARTDSLASPSIILYPYHAFVPDKGLELRHAGVTCPILFSGDLTFIVRFYLKADASHSLFFSISMSDATCMGAGSDLHLDVVNVGTVDEAYAIFDHEPSAMIVPLYTADDLPGLNRDGINEFILTKTGDQVKIEINGTPVESEILDRYESQWFAPNIEVQIGSYAPDGIYGLVIESIKVVYPSGNREEMIII